MATLHRNLSLLSVTMVIAHVVTTVLDPFAHITVRDVIVPFGASYRPVFLGLGVAGFYILIAVVVTSLIRDRMGPRAWRLIHWASYGSWPLSVVHGLGTGSDAQAPWLIGLATSCVVAVVLALAIRIARGRLATLPIRAGSAFVAISILYAMVTWAFQGPFQPGWSVRAGTPAGVETPGPVHPGPDGFSDPLVGVMVRDARGNTEISMRDTVDTDLTIVISSPTGNETLPVVTIARKGRALCTVPASVGATLYTVCGTTRLTITLYDAGPITVGTANISGRLETSGPLN